MNSEIIQLMSSLDTFGVRLLVAALRFASNKTQFHMNKWENEQTANDVYSFIPRRYNKYR